MIMPARNASSSPAAARPEAKSAIATLTASATRPRPIISTTEAPRVASISWRRFSARCCAMNLVVPSEKPTSSIEKTVVSVNITLQVPNPSVPRVRTRIGVSTSALSPTSARWPYELSAFSRKVRLPSGRGGGPGPSPAGSGIAVEPLRPRGEPGLRGAGQPLKKAAAEGAGGARQVPPTSLPQRRSEKAAGGLQPASSRQVARGRPAAQPGGAELHSRCPGGVGVLLTEQLELRHDLAGVGDHHLGWVVAVGDQGLGAGARPAATGGANPEVPVGERGEALVEATDSLEQVRADDDACRAANRVVGEQPAGEPPRLGTVGVVDHVPSHVDLD